MKHVCGIFLFFAMLPCLVRAQTNTYILNGSSTQNSCNCYTLTTETNNQSGSVWNANKIDLNLPFDFVFNVYLGCKDASGADGIVFMLQPISTSVGATGGGLGFQGISPSVGVVLDTWQNTNNNDPVDDHIAIQANGNLTHGTDLAGPVQASSTSPNIEDCNWHTLRVAWNPTIKNLDVYFDGVFRLRSTTDIIATIFNNDPMVYWGFSAGTGGSNNLQQFCTALNPGFSINGINNTVCYGTPVTFSSTSQSFTTIAAYYWDFGDGQTSTLENPPPHNYAAPGIYNTKLVITGMDGCISDTLRRTITVADYPVVDFSVFDTCGTNMPRILNHSTLQIGTPQWQWSLDGNPVSAQQVPQLTGLSEGTHQLQLTVTSSTGCAAAPVTKSFFVNVLRPQFSTNLVNDAACFGNPVSFSNSSQATTAIANHYWDFGDNTNSTTAVPAPHTYTGHGQFEIKYSFSTPDGCRSDTIRKTITIADHPVANLTAFDTCAGLPVRITASSQVAVGSISQWDWTLNGAALPSTQQPQLPALPAGTHQLELVTNSSYGCSSAPVSQSFNIHPVPLIQAQAVNGCVNEPVSFSAQQIDNATSIISWNWSFGDGQTSNIQNPQHTYNQLGNYNVGVTAISANGCSAVPVILPVFINRAVANAGNDTIVIMNTPFQLQGSGGGQYNWSPATGLNDATLQNPVATLQDDITYTLAVTTPEGCTDTDEVTIAVFKGSAVYVPTGFTPNGDGLNDLMRPYCVGIQKLEYFTVYNRWGQMIFTTKTIGDGWNGVYKGAAQTSGTYIWTLKAIDYVGKIYTLKGMTTLLR